MLKYYNFYIGVKNNSYSNGDYVTVTRTGNNHNYVMNTDNWDSARIRIDFTFHYGNSNQETRPKSKFFSLLIYAGYPIA